MKSKKKAYNCFMSLFCMAFLLVGCAEKEMVYLEETQEEARKEGEAGIEPEEKEASQETIFVYVCGAVKNPGVYELRAEQRVCDALEAAGGMLENADAEELNQAETLSDGQMIRVLTGEEKEEQKAAEEKAGLVNINTANVDALMQLPGIGESKAEDIISYREAQGGFQTIEELKNVSGIKDGVYNKIKDSITVN